MFKPLTNLVKELEDGFFIIKAIKKQKDITQVKINNKHARC